MKEKGCLYYFVVIITFPISIPILTINKLYHDIKIEKNIRKMDNIYKKGYCPFINGTCIYEYCEFWNNQTKHCEIKNTN